MEESSLCSYFVSGNEYKATKLLGKGFTCETWLVTDGINQYALKKILSTFDSAEMREILEESKSDYATLKDAGIPVPGLLEIDYENGIILKEYIHGECAFNYIAKREKSEKILEQLREIYDKAECAGIYLDYHSMNFVVNNDRLVYIDYKCSQTQDEAKVNFEKTVSCFWKANSPEFASVFYDIVMKYGE